MKRCSPAARPSQSRRSPTRSSSSAVQNEAMACLYIFHMSLYWMGNNTKRRGFSRNSNSVAEEGRASSMVWFTNTFQKRNV